MLALIDGDIFRYRCGFAAERNHYLVELTNANGHKEWKEFPTKKEAQAYSDRVTTGVSATVHIWNRKEVQPLDHALQIVKQSLTQTLEDIKSYAKVDQVSSTIYLSGKHNFRQSVAITKTYKGNRENTPKPVHYDEIGLYLTGQWNAVTTDGIEADDALGIAAMEAKAKGEANVIVSNDKDLRQIPGLHYDWTKKEFLLVSAREAKTRFFIQLLAGDATDNVPGIPGIGEAKAAKILEECKSPTEMVDACAKAYQEQALLFNSREQTWFDYFLEQASLVYILKHPHEYWTNTKEGLYFTNKYLINGKQEKEQVNIPPVAVGA